MPYKSKEKEKAYKKQYYLDNIEKRKEYFKSYRTENKEKIKLRVDGWYEENKEKRKEYFNERRPLIRIWENNKYKTDINFKLKKLVRGRLTKILKGKKLFTTMELIGCTVDELKKHLESKFEPWMNWENQGRGGWDIDHIIAMSKFDLKCPVQQHACCHWSNLQPLGHIANMKKGTK